MRLFLILLASLALVTAGALSYHHLSYHSRKSVPTIGVKIVEEDSWSGSTSFLPMINGYIGGFESTAIGATGGNYEVNASYQVVSSSPGHFFVLAHYKISRNGTSTDADRALQVQPSYKPSPLAQEKLKRTTWSDLNGHLSAFAYASDTTTSY
jgi:hypothetical protein